MSERTATLTMQIVADTSAAKKAVDDLIKEAQGKRISVPISPSGSSSPGQPQQQAATTIGGLNAGMMPTASPNWSFHFARMTQELTAGISKAMLQAIQAAVGNVQQGGGSAPGAPSPSGGNAGVFNRVVGRLVGGYAVGAAVNAFVGYGRDRQLEDVAGTYGTQRDVLNAQRNTYNNLIGGLPLLGPLLDWAAGGSASFAQQDYEQKHADESIQSGVRQLSIQRHGKIGVITEINKRIAATTRGRFAPRRNAADFAFDELRLQFADQEQEYEDRIAAEDDPYKANDLRSELNQTIKAHKNRLTEARKTRDATKYRVNEDEGSYSEVMSGRARAARLAGRGQLRAAELVAFDADARAQLENTSGEERVSVYNYLTAQRAAIVDARTRGDLGAGVALGSQLRAIDALRRHDPRSAILHRANAALQAAEGDTGDPNVARRKQLIVAQQHLEEQEFDQGTEAVRLRQVTRHREIDRLLDRDPYGAQAAGIVGSSREQANALLNSGRRLQAVGQLQLGIRELDLFRQQYGDTFRGRQLDLRHFDATNKRDTEDPGKVLKEIRDGQDELIRVVKDLASDD